MCGIAGIVGSRLRRDELEAALQRMQASLAHRGPDGRGLWISSDGSAGLAHTRLAILDLSENAAQPMELDGSRLVFNGEIYNYRELHTASSDEGGDTRALLRHLVARSSAGLRDLAGMFALGLYEVSARTLLLARDSCGIKPLYYADTRDGFVFASEVRAILASGLVSRRIDAEGAAAFFRTGSVPEPLTLVRGISCLPAGRLLLRRANGSFDVTRWEEGRDPSAAGSLSEALAESCRRHLVSDVPVGVFLSGGVDSAAVARLAALAGQVTEAFSLVFSEEAFSEEKAIRSAADALGLPVRMQRLSCGEARTRFPEFLAAQDQPSIDGFNTFCVARLASEHGCRVALSGMGGDELFGGYPSFRTVPEWNARREWIPRSIARPVGRILESSVRNGKLRRVGSWLQRSNGSSSAWELVRGLFSDRETEILLGEFGIANPQRRDVSDECGEIDDGRLAVACLESTRYMRNQLLRDSDAMTMAHGLELRVPLVDRRLWESVRQMDANLRFQPGKAALRDAVPSLDAVISPGPKRGFTLPLQEWLDPSWQGMPEAKPLSRRLDLRHWSRKMAVISFRAYLERHAISAGGPEAP